MPGNKNSGRRPRILSREEARHALRKLTRKSITVISGSLEKDDVATAWRVLEHIIGKPRQALDDWSGDGHAQMDYVPRKPPEISQEVMEGALSTLIEAGVSIDTAGFLVPSEESDAAIERLRASRSGDQAQ